MGESEVICGFLTSQGFLAPDPLIVQGSPDHLYTYSFNKYILNAHHAQRLQNEYVWSLKSNGVFWSAEAKLCYGDTPQISVAYSNAGLFFTYEFTASGRVKRTGGNRNWFLKYLL